MVLKLAIGGKKSTFTLLTKYRMKKFCILVGNYSMITIGPQLVVMFP